MKHHTENIEERAWHIAEKEAEKIQDFREYNAVLIKTFREAKKELTELEMIKVQSNEYR